MARKQTPRQIGEIRERERPCSLEELRAHLVYYRNLLKLVGWRIAIRIRDAKAMRFDGEVQLGRVEYSRVYKRAYIYLLDAGDAQVHSPLMEQDYELSLVHELLEICKLGYSEDLEGDQAIAKEREIEVVSRALVAQRRSRRRFSF